MILVCILSAQMLANSLAIPPSLSDTKQVGAPKYWIQCCVIASQMSEGCLLLMMTATENLVQRQIASRMIQEKAKSKST